MKLHAIVPDLGLLKPTLPAKAPDLPTRNKKILFVTNRPDDSLHSDLRNLLQTNSIEFGVFEGNAVRSIESYCTGIEAKRYDFVFAAVGFMNHLMDGMFSKACKKSETPYLRVQKGRPAACLRAMENYFRSELDKGALIRGMKEAKTLASTKPEEELTSISQAPVVEDPAEAPSPLPEPATVAVPDLSSFVAPQKDSSTTRWSAAELLALVLMKKEGIAAKERSEILLASFGTTRTMRTIHQTHYHYFTLGKGTLPVGFEELRSKNLTLNELLSALPSPEKVPPPFEAPKPDKRDLKRKAKAPVAPSEPSPNPSEKMKISYNSVRVPLLTILLRYRGRGPLSISFVMEEAMKEMGLDPELLRLNQLQNAFSNARFDLRKRDFIQSNKTKWWITDAGAKALVDGNFKESPPVVVPPPSVVEVPVQVEVAAKVETQTPSLVEAPAPLAVIPTAPALKAAPTKITIEVVSDGVKIDSVMITGSSGSGGLIDTKRSFAEILAFLYS